MLRIRAFIETGCRRFASFTKRFRKNQRGNVAFIFAMLAIPVFAIAGSAVDFGRAMNTQKELTNAIDAAALAAGSALSLSTDDRVQLAKDYFKGNFKTPKFATIGEPTVTVEDLKITIKVIGSVETAFLGVLAIKNIAVAASNEVILATKKVEVVLALDNTGSMAGSKVNALKTSTNHLLDILFDNASQSDSVKVGIVPFAEFVNIGTEYKNKSWFNIDKSTNIYCEQTNWDGDFETRNKCKSFKYTPASWKGCVKPRDNPNDATDAPATASDPISGVPGPCHVQPLTRLSSNRNDLHADVVKMQASGWAYMPIGLSWAWRLLAPVDPFAEAASYEDEEWEKSILLFTDGSNTARYRNTRGSADSRTTAVCNGIKSKNIKVYTVTLEVTDNTVKSLLRDCATNSHHYFDATDSTSLEAAFETIAIDILSLRISR